METDGKLLEVKGLKTWFGSETEPVKAVDGVSFTVGAGETVALVGESGCGKSVAAMSLARLIPQPPGFYAGGEILFQGEDVLRMSDQRLLELRGRDISYVFQEPSTSLNPVFRVGDQIMEALQLHRKDVDAKSEAIKLMTMVGLPDPDARVRAYPHEMSGGMQQRVMIAMALACRPKLLVADEPTTALDVTIQAQILDLLSSLQKDLEMAVVLITHNLGLVADTAHSVYVMYSGRIVESGLAEEVLSKPVHPYSRGLLDAVPRLGIEGKAGEKPDRMKGIPGSVPHPAHLPEGCKFAPRCSRAQDVCRKTEPEIKCGEGGHCVRCHFPL